MDGGGYFWKGFIFSVVPRMHIVKDEEGFVVTAPLA